MEASGSRYPTDHKDRRTVSYQQLKFPLTGSAEEIAAELERLPEALQAVDESDGVDHARVMRDEVPIGFDEGEERRAADILAGLDLPKPEDFT